ncbi:uncharacterized protein MYCFIDRAFT_177446 [Pseudocercospora fijiensis CIRAD86]|uniref:Uncharacterized protein n=1 Tax=Pseudocercospora fijiensis (strain CIRAD86) TaxID=383855 RepID=M2ZN16_PSEFD|nr:uncharacterized protein MYCFIDRAFT_177446 [Pseudocercospora fijiensis CIRAD86]EME80504.1 hypothetical protein MYCFIDRAFT_177446 [Pseudocercospora fijiensis CIRAD86]
MWTRLPIGSSSVLEEPSRRQRYVLACEGQTSRTRLQGVLLNRERQRSLGRESIAEPKLPDSSTRNGIIRSIMVDCNPLNTAGPIGYKTNRSDDIGRHSDGYGPPSSQSSKLEAFLHGHLRTISAGTQMELSITPNKRLDSATCASTTDHDLKLRILSKLFAPALKTLDERATLAHSTRYHDLMRRKADTATRRTQTRHPNLETSTRSRQRALVASPPDPRRTQSLKWSPRFRRRAESSAALHRLSRGWELKFAESVKWVWDAMSGRQKKPFKLLRRCHQQKQASVRNVRFGRDLMAAFDCESRTPSIGLAIQSNSIRLIPAD